MNIDFVETFFNYYQHNTKLGIKVGTLWFFGVKISIFLITSYILLLAIYIRNMHFVLECKWDTKERVANLISEVRQYKKYLMLRACYVTLRDANILILCYRHASDLLAHSYVQCRVGWKHVTRPALKGLVDLCLTYLTCLMTIN